MIGRLQFLVLLLLLAIPVFTFAQTGKVVGKVTDLETGEPLIGANIILLTTSLGAATDENGDFIILNVPPGKYDIKARYIGYREKLIKGVNVSVNLTTETNFQLPTEEYTTQEVVVQAQRPLINKNITNSISVVKSEDIENLPVRGVNSVVAIQAGVVSGAADGGLNIRGSRNDGVAYYVDGVLVNNPVFGGAQTSTINNAIEEIQVQTGGYSAEFGGANGGIISTQTKTGSDKYKITVEGITDNFASLGEKYLGSYSRHYSEYSLTVGGPLLPSNKKIRFFLAGNNTFIRTPSAFYRGVNYPELHDPLSSTKDTFSVVYPDGYLLNYNRNTYQVQGNLTFDFNPFQIRVNANYRRTDGRNGVGKTAIKAYNSAGLHQDYTFVGSLKLTQVISNNLFYDLVLDYFRDYYVDMDPLLKDNVVAYGDSIANAQVGRHLQGDSYLPNPDYAYGANYSTLAFVSEDREISQYRKQGTIKVGGKINLLYQLGKHHEIKTGIEFNRYTVRRYQISSFYARQIAINQIAVADLDQSNIYNFLDNYGYDLSGNKSETGITAPKNPVFAAYYLQDKMEFSDLVVNVGLRLDYIDTDGQIFKNPHNIEFQNNKITPESFLNMDPFLQVSPRLGFSFPVTDQTVFHAQYGKFIQQSQLRNLYYGNNAAASIIKGGLAIQNPVGYGLRPERTTSYEIGFKQQIGNNFAFDVTGFYKDVKDQIQERQITAEIGAKHKSYYAYVNGDFSTIKGIELKLDMRRTERLAFTLDYTYSNALGTGSNSSSAFRAIWQTPTSEPFFPQQIAPLEFNQAQRGFLNIDYRWGENDGGAILERFGFNILMGFNSGFNYTRWTGFGNTRVPTEPLNSSVTPWNFNIDAKFDKSLSIGGINLNIYIWILNLLNTQNETSVYNVSGDAYQDGWLASDEGKATAESYRQISEQESDNYKKVYSDFSYNANNFGSPRQIRLGIKLNY